MCLVFLDGTLNALQYNANLENGNAIERSRTTYQFKVSVKKLVFKVREFWIKTSAWCMEEWCGRRLKSSQWQSPCLAEEVSGCSQTPFHIGSASLRVSWIYTKLQMFRWISMCTRWSYITMFVQWQMINYNKITLILWDIMFPLPTFYSLERCMWYFKSMQNKDKNVQLEQ